MKCTSWSDASSAYAVDRSSSRASRGQTMRTVDESGGIEKPAIAAAAAIARDARVRNRESHDHGEERGEQHGADLDHAGRAVAVDLPPADRRADAERDRVDGDDEPRGGVALPLAPDEQEQRERRHADGHAGR